MSIKTQAPGYRSLLISIGLALAVFLAMAAFNSRHMLPADREAAPRLAGQTISGAFYDLSRSAGRPALVYFFAPWCKVCAASADNLARLRRWRDGTDLEMVAVALDWENVDSVRAYATRHQLELPVLLGDGDIARQWRVYGYPSYYVLDGKHGIARRDAGYSSQFGLWWRTWLVN